MVGLEDEDGSAEELDSNPDVLHSHKGWKDEFLDDIKKKIAARDAPEADG